VPVATLVKWFRTSADDHRLAVAGFGRRRDVTAPLAKRLMASVGVLQDVRVLGVAYFLGGDRRSRVACQKPGRRINRPPGSDLDFAR